MSGLGGNMKPLNGFIKKDVSFHVRFSNGVCNKGVCSSIVSGALLLADPRCERPTSIRSYASLHDGINP